MSNVRSVVDWLQDGARSAPRAEDVLAQLCARLLERGTPLWRVAVFVRTLHPDIMGRAFFWQPGAAVRAQTATYEFMETAEFRDSPVAAVYKTAQAIRRHLDDPSCPDDFPMLRDLRGQGATDYVAFPLFFTNGSIHVATWTTKQKGGFTAQEFSDLESVIAPLARVAEVRAWVRTAENLLSTYIGNQAGERIMAGNIRRGDVEAISAAIWLSDMRGFTTLSERLPPKELIALLNRYFDAQVRRSWRAAARCSNSWATACWRSSPLPAMVMPPRFAVARLPARLQRAIASPNCRARRTRKARASASRSIPAR